VQLTATHWFYLYIVWFLPFVLVTMFAAYRERPPAASVEESRTRTAVAA
jgi:hypothetical protein